MVIKQESGNPKTKMNKNNKSLTEEIEYLNDYLKFFRSSLAQNILLSLDGEGKHLKHLQELTKSKSRGKINEYLNWLENIGVVERGVGKRALTPIGNAVKIKFDEFIKTLIVIKKNKTYWETHLINIPDKFLQYLYVFHDAKVVTNSIDDDTKVLRTVENEVVKSNCFYALVSGYSKNYRKIVESILKHNGKVRIIINRNLYNIILNREPEIEKKIKDYENMQIFLSEDLDKFTLLFTDRVVFLFLFKKNENIEWNECLYSKNKEAVILAGKIFKFYREKSSKI